jgi:acetylglutamate/LysW-gamma-L-alpha-aminoadipate kinase
MLIVVKIGGAAGIGAHLPALAVDIASVVRGGEDVVVVHGGSDEVDTLGDRLGVARRRIESPSGHSSRYTDPATMEVFIMATAGLVNTRLVEALRAAGVNAAGLSGVDGGLLTGERKTAVRSVEGGKVKVIRDDLSAAITAVNASLLRLLLANGYVPVVAPMVLATTGETCNVDADRAAAAIASALGAAALVLLTNVPGLLTDPADHSTLVRRMRAADAGRYEPFAAGRMKKKLLAAVEAVRGGAGRSVIGDARRERPLTLALAGEGTEVTL